MPKHTIEVHGLPEGWEVQKVTVEENGVTCTWKEGKRMTVKAEIKLKKTKPRRIVLEETGEVISTPKLNSYLYFYITNDGFDRFKVLREVKEE